MNKVNNFGLGEVKSIFNFFSTRIRDLDMLENNKNVIRNSSLNYLFRLIIMNISIQVFILSILYRDWVSTNIDSLYITVYYVSFFISALSIYSYVSGIRMGKMKIYKDTIEIELQPIKSLVITPEYQQFLDEIKNCRRKLYRLERWIILSFFVTLTTNSIVYYIGEGEFYMVLYVNIMTTLLFVSKMSNHHKEEYDFFINQIDKKFDANKAYNYSIVYSEKYGTVYYEYKNRNLDYYIYDKNRDDFICVNVIKFDSLYKARVAAMELTEKVYKNIEQYREETNLMDKERGEL